jgi:hypothetical protein
LKLKKSFETFIRSSAAMKTSAVILFLIFVALNLSGAFKSRAEINGILRNHHRNSDKNSLRLNVSLRLGVGVGGDHDDDDDPDVSKRRKRKEHRRDMKLSSVSSLSDSMSPEIGSSAVTRLRRSKSFAGRTSKIPSLAGNGSTSINSTSSSTGSFSLTSTTDSISQSSAWEASRASSSESSSSVESSVVGDDD